MIPEQVPPHLEPSFRWLGALGAAGPARERAPGGNEWSFWEDREFGTGSIQLLPGRALGASLQALHCVASALTCFYPSSPLHFLSDYLFCDFSVVLLGLLMGEVGLLEAGQPCRKENKVDAE